MTYSFLSRSRITIFFIIIFGLLLSGKLFLVQVVRGESYSESADRQYATPSQNIYERGTIFFQNKSTDGREGQLIAAATQTTGFKVAIVPGKIGDAESVYAQLSEITELDQKDFFLKAKKTEDPYEEVATHLSKEEADAISALKIPGISVFPGAAVQHRAFPE